PDNHLMNKMKKIVSDDELEERTIEPAMPLKTTHLATAIASGSLPETMGDHLLVGVSKQEETHKSVEDEKGDVSDITTTNTKSIVIKKTYLATDIESSSLHKTMVDHLLVGVIKQEETHKSVENEKVDVRDITTTNTKSIVRVFSHKGIFNLQDD